MESKWHGVFVCVCGFIRACVCVCKYAVCVHLCAYMNLNFVFVCCVCAQQSLCLHCPYSIIYVLTDLLSGRDCTHTHTHTRSLAHTHTHTKTQTRTHKHSHTHTHRGVWKYDNIEHQGSQSPLFKLFSLLFCSLVVFLSFSLSLALVLSLTLSSPSVCLSLSHTNRERESERFIGPLYYHLLSFSSCLVCCLAGFPIGQASHYHNKTTLR